MYRDHAKQQRRVHGFCETFQHFRDLHFDNIKRIVEIEMKAQNYQGSSSHSKQEASQVDESKDSQQNGKQQSDIKDDSQISVTEEAEDDEREVSNMNINIIQPVNPKSSAEDGAENHQQGAIQNAEQNSNPILEITTKFEASQPKNDERKMTIKKEQEPNRFKWLINWMKRNISPAEDDLVSTQIQAV